MATLLVATLVAIVIVTPRRSLNNPGHVCFFFLSETILGLCCKDSLLTVRATVSSVTGQWKPFIIKLMGANVKNQKRENKILSFLWWEIKSYQKSVLIWWTLGCFHLFSWNILLGLVGFVFCFCFCFSFCVLPLCDPQSWVGDKDQLRTYCARNIFSVR